MSTVPYADGVARMVDAGHTDAQIMDFYRDVTFTMDGRTYSLEVMLVAIRRLRGIPNPAEEPGAPVAASPDGPTSAEVEAERARRIRAGEPAGYDALAAHFHVGTTTIRRRLGKSA